MDKITVTITTKDHTLNFTGLSDPVATHKFIREVWEKQQSSASGVDFSPSQHTGRVEKRNHDNLQPTEEDWALILKGAVLANYKKNEPIILEGTTTLHVGSDRWNLL